MPEALDHKFRHASTCDSDEGPSGYARRSHTRPHFRTKRSAARQKSPDCRDAQSIPCA